MNFKFATLAIATAISVSGSAAYAQQLEQYGRDSVYATTARPAGNIKTWADANRYARDSVYAAQLPAPSVQVITDARGLQPFGRDSVQVDLFQNGSAQQTNTAVGTTSTKGAGG